MVSLLQLLPFSFLILFAAPFLPQNLASPNQLQNLASPIQHAKSIHQLSLPQLNLFKQLAFLIFHHSGALQNTFHSNPNHI
jgi:hypothetical protein